MVFNTNVKNIQLDINDIQVHDELTTFYGWGVLSDEGLISLYLQSTQELSWTQTAERDTPLVTPIISLMIKYVFIT